MDHVTNIEVLRRMGKDLEHDYKSEEITIFWTFDVRERISNITSTYARKDIRGVEEDQEQVG